MASISQIPVTNALLESSSARFCRVLDADNLTGWLSLTSNIKNFFNTIQDKAMDIALVSVIGPTYSDTSFLTNFIVKFLKIQEDQIWQNGSTPNHPVNIVNPVGASPTFLPINENSTGLFLLPTPFKLRNKQVILLQLNKSNKEECINYKFEDLSEDFLRKVSTWIFEVVEENEIRVPIRKVTHIFRKVDEAGNFICTGYTAYQDNLALSPPTTEENQSHSGLLQKIINFIFEGDKIQIRKNTNNQSLIATRLLSFFEYCVNTCNTKVLGNEESRTSSTSGAHDTKIQDSIRAGKLAVRNISTDDILSVAYDELMYGIGSSKLQLVNVHVIGKVVDYTFRNIMKDMEASVDNVESNLVFLMAFRNYLMTRLEYILMPSATHMRAALLAYRDKISKEFKERVFFREYELSQILRKTYDDMLESQDYQGIIEPLRSTVPEACRHFSEEFKLHNYIVTCHNEDIIGTGIEIATARFQTEVQLLFSKGMQPKRTVQRLYYKYRGRFLELLTMMREEANENWLAKLSRTLYLSYQRIKHHKILEMEQGQKGVARIIQTLVEAYENGLKDFLEKMGQSSSKTEYDSMEKALREALLKKFKDIMKDEPVDGHVKTLTSHMGVKRNMHSVEDKVGAPVEGETPDGIVADEA